LLHSSTMVKAGVYIIIRLAPLLGHNAAGVAVTLVGGVTFFATAVLAVSQSDAKKILAYSTVSNLGLIVACAGINTAESLWAAIMLIVFHAIAKSLLFLAVGSTEHRLGSRNVEDMDGLFQISVALTTLLAVGIAGMFVAPFGMLISKWAAMKAFLDSNNIFIVLLVAFGGTVTLFFWTQWMGKLIANAHRTPPTPYIMRIDEKVSLNVLAGLVIAVCFVHPLISYYFIIPYIDGNHFTNPAGGGSAAFSVGSEMSGSVRDVFAEGNVAAGAGLAYLLKLKTNSYRGGAIDGVYLRDDTIDQTIRGLVNFDTGYSESAAQPDGDIFNPVIRNVSIDDVNAAPSVSTSYPAFVSDAQPRSPVSNVLYENSTFYTTSPFEASFNGHGAFFAGAAIRNVTFTNPVTHVSQAYNSVPLGLENATTAHSGATAVLLHPEGDAGTGSENRVPQPFTVTGKVADYGQSQPAVQVFLDRSTAPVPVTAGPDGSFQTGAITLDNSQYWYRGTHYLSVNLRNGIDVNTIVYLISTG